MPELRWVLLASVLALSIGFSIFLAKRYGLFAPVADRVLVYKQVDGHALSLHFFAPHAHSRSTPAPVLLFFHGGGWQFGDPKQFFPQCRHFREMGYACVSAAYRIASVHGSTPADALQDARDAMRYLRRHAESLGLAADKIVAAGGSAGGHLAAALGTAVSLPDPGADSVISTRPNALVLFNPMLNLAPGQPDHEWVAAYWHAISPFHHVDGATPPTLILSGADDAEVPVSTVDAFCQLVRKQGGHCEAVIYPGAGHGFFNAGVGGGRYFTLTNQAVADFLGRPGLLRPSGRALSDEAH